MIICDIQAVASMSSPEFAVQALYSRHHGWLNTWLRPRLGNAVDAADHRPLAARRNRTRLPQNHSSPTGSRNPWRRLSVGYSWADASVTVSYQF
jgi:hypothetical protein